MRRPLFSLTMGSLLGLCLACAHPGAEPEQRASTSKHAPSSIEDPLDAAVSKGWRSAGIEPSPQIEDLVFLRRVSLDLIGRVPTVEEAQAFSANRAPDKRATKVDELLGSEAFARHWASLWSELLLPADKRARRITAAPLESYLADALIQNQSWASVTSVLLTGEGALEDQPELAYLGARDFRGGGKQDTLAELSSTTARVFLGSRIECAQCHDHPYDSSFSQADFWAMTAYFGRTVVELEQRKPPEIAIYERNKGELRVALGVGDDPRKQAIAPRFLGEDDRPSTSNSEPIEPRRVQLAQRIVADPRFAEATAGYVWTRLLGRGPEGSAWDELLGAGERGPILSTLAQEFRADDHDLRALIRRVVLSKAYQRSSASSRIDPQEIEEAEAIFAQAPIRQLSAVQLFASLITVTGSEGFKRQDKAFREYELLFTDDENASGGNLSQALLLLNGGLTNRAIVARSGSRLAAILEHSDDTGVRLEALWLAVYGRPPTTAERRLGHRAVGEGQRPADWEDLMFAMLNSTEFTSNH